MKIPGLPTFSRKIALGIFFVTVLWVITLVISFNADSSEAITKYHVTRSSLNVLLVVLSIPSLFIWAALVYAVMTFYSYARLIGNSKDGVAFRWIGHALALSLVGMIASNFFNQIRNFKDSAGNTVISTDQGVIAANYLAVSVALFTSWFFLRGSMTLLESIKQKTSVGKLFQKAWLPMLLISGFYVVLVFSNQDRTVATHASVTRPTYALSDPLIILTIVVPYIVSWFFGLLAIVGITRFQHETNGIVYKRVFRKLALGLSLIIGLTISLQLLTQFTGFLSNSKLSAILGIITIIYIVIIAAYVFIARAAARLSLIESFQTKDD
jgi:hypothetical protein